MPETPETTTCQPCAIANRAARHINDGLAAEGQQGTATHDGICQGHGCECGCTPETSETAPPSEFVRETLPGVFNAFPESIRKVDDGQALLDALAEILPAFEAMVHAELFGTPEEIAARAAEPAKPDDIADLCERARPGHHAKRVRAQVAEEIEAQKTGCEQHPMPFPRPSCWTCARDGAFHRAARVARGEQP